MSAGISDLSAKIRTGIDKVLHPKVFWVLLLVVSMLPAVYSALAQKTRAVTLWFPGIHGLEPARQEPVAELRFIKSDGDIAPDAVRILDELFLGSLNAKFESLTIPGSYVDSVLYRKNVLYIDLSTDILFGRLMSSGISRAPQFQPETVLALAARTLAWNFPGRRIVLTIGGFEPSWDLRVPSKEAKKE